MKYKKWFLGCFAIAVMLNVCGCYSFVNNHRTLVDMAHHFKNNGVKIEEIQQLMPYFDSDAAMSLQISGLQIGIYKYNSTVEKQRLRLEDITDKGYVFVESMKFPVLVNGTFMLIGYEKNPQKKKIMEVFYSF